MAFASMRGLPFRQRFSDPKPPRVHAFTHTLRLSELMEDNDVVGVVEVLGQGVDVLTAQPVGHEDRRSVSVCPVDTILQHTHAVDVDFPPPTKFYPLHESCKLSLNAIQVKSEKMLQIYC